jgi:hypothetical protein
MATFGQQLWRNILKIRTDNDAAFARYILEARSEFLSLRLRQEPAIRQVYVDAAANVAKDLARLAPGASDLTRNHLRALEKSLTREAEGIRQALEARLRGDLSQAVGLGARALQTHMTGALQAAGVGLDAARVQRAFGSVNTAAVEAIWARTKNGMKLSDRIWQTSDNARENMRSIILDGVARGRDAVKVARDLQQYVKQGAATMAGDYPGMMARIGRRVPKDITYEALRLARTEMSMAFLEGTYAAGKTNPAYKGVRWLLSSSHPLPDVCDDLASADMYGLGPGGYPAGDEPPLPHPQCLCVASPLAENTQEFVDRLKEWLDDPGSQPELEKWYNEVYSGKGAAQPSATGPGPQPEPPTLEQAIVEKEKLIANLPHERAYVFDAAGTVLLEKDGGKGSVSFDASELALMKDAVLTHNHPTAGGSFSPEDIHLAAKYDMAEIRAVGKTYRHSASRPVLGWSEQFWDSAIRPSYRRHEADVMREFRAAILNGSMTVTQAEQQHWHEIWTRVAKEVGFAYVRTQW